MRVLAKKSGNVGSKATSVLNKWRDVVANTKSNETPCLKENAYPKEMTDHISSKPSQKDEKAFKKYTEDKHFKDKHYKNDKHFKDKSFEKSGTFTKPEHSKEKVKSPTKEKHFKEKHSKEKFSKEACGLESKSKHVKDIKNGHTSAMVCDSIPANVNSSIKKKYDKDKKQGLQPKSVKRSKYDSDSEEKSCNSKDNGYDVEYRNLSFNGGHELSQGSESPTNSDSSITNEPTFKKSKKEMCSSPNKEFSFKLSQSSSPNSDKLSKSSDSEHLTKKKTPKTHTISATNSSIHESSKVKASSDKVKDKKLSKKGDTEGFTSSETTFEDCLSFNDNFPRKKKKTVIVSSKKSKEVPKNVEKYTKIKTPKVSLPKEISREKEISKRKEISKKKEISQGKDSFREKEIDLQVPAEPFQNNIPILRTVDVACTLPPTQPNYRPLPQRSYEFSPIKKQENPMSNEEAIKYTTSRREKTNVYSGRKNKNCYLTEPPSLFECCTRVLIDNIDDIEYMGEIPYFLLESMLKRCTPSQLYRIEDFNPYLLEDTNELWETHCKRDYRIAKRQESETWRELYWRSHDEREQRLRSITANISASIANSNPTRKAKLAYVDSVVKPPRDVARRQAKHGTALPTSHTVKAGPPSKASPRPTAPSINSAAAAVSTSRPRVEAIKPMKPKVAPLMAKTLKSMKQCFRR